MGAGAVKEAGAIVAEQALAAYCPDLAEQARELAH
jgi:hypothetical protein